MRKKKLYRRGTARWSTLLIASLLIISGGIVAGAEETTTSAPKTAERVTATAAPDGSLADEAKFPQEEVLIAEKYWEKFAYNGKNAGEKTFDMIWYDTLLKSFQTPEIYYYFPLFIEFCKEKDLTTYQADRDYTAYEYCFNDFEKFVIEKSKYGVFAKSWRWTFEDAYVERNPNPYMRAVKYFVQFNENTGYWEVFDYNEDIKNFKEYEEVIGKIEPISDSFEPYKKPAQTTAAETNISTKLGNDTAITVPKTVDNKDPSWAGDKFPIVWIVVGGVLLAGGVSVGIIVGKGGKK